MAICNIVFAPASLLLRAPTVSEEFMVNQITERSTSIFHSPSSETVQKVIFKRLGYEMQMQRRYGLYIQNIKLLLLLSSQYCIMFYISLNN